MAIVERPLFAEEWKQRANEADDNSIQNKAGAQQEENEILRGGSPGRKSLRF